jgi:hypothetical protein
VAHISEKCISASVQIKNIDGRGNNDMKVFQLSRLSLLASAMHGRSTRCRLIDHSKRNQPTAAKQSVRHTIELTIATPEEAMHGGKSAGITAQYQNNSNNLNNYAGQSPVSSNSWGFTLTDAAGELVTDNVISG